VESAAGRTAVVVVNFASSGLVADNLAGLEAERPDCVIVLVDSYSGDTERDRARALAVERGWVFVAPEENVGFGGGCNLGAERALSIGAARILLLNPDARLEPGALAVLEARLASDPLALVAPRVVRPDGSLWSAGSDLYLADGRIRSPRARDAHPGEERAFWLSGACLLLGRELWEELGGFRDEYFLYWEDVDLSWRVAAAGHPLTVCSDAVAVHAEGGTQAEGRQASGEPKSDVYYVHNIRNRFLFARLNLPPATAARWRGQRLSLAIAWEVLLQGGRRQFLRRPGLLWRAWGAVREGRRLTYPHHWGQKGEKSSR
jgi:GT2 family glycosyltransferase